MSVTESLFRLDQIDAELERLQSDLQEARRRQRQNPELDGAEARLETLGKEEGELSFEQRSLDSSLSDFEAKIKRDQSRMYSGQIVDSRELASLEKELGHYAQQRDALEERLLPSMERLEALQADMGAVRSQVNDLRSRWEEERPTLVAREEEIALSLGGLQSEQEELVSSIDPRSLDLYRRMLSSSRRAVATVSNGICQSCRVGVPAKDVQHARSGALVLCTNCGRILHPNG